ncbi:MAG: methionine--tRNA ligase [Alphaproteobacteria bacterium]|jgi:methionyl-tRNA synthetase|nr:methionine--tRNA ligase [Alphaproteobacteria bacterium]MBT4020239.1 methionine--tRNA ligase [Alphaproteobacteria bacterium]MBT4965860.1 methionine--tRNA ligase [Alphaproteobacteria bacterium]MBT5158299.1 methionine--tRNA ligase [Alphaproteobacteria bacterium]
MSDRKNFYITTPIYYVNDAPHIGHAYTTLACDVLARFKRLDGYNVNFLTGTDEHGQKVEKSAAAAGKDPQTFTDEVSQNFRDLAGVMNFSNDDFIRTTEPRHTKATQAIWNALLEAGDIYLDSYSGWYSVRDEAFYGEDELVKGTDGKKLAPTGAEVEWVEEPSYFFRLSAWGDRLLEFYEANPDFILPETRRNEVVSFVRGGLRDLSVSRTSFNWGVPVPGDDKHIMYVWLDALTNYITAVGYPDTDSDSYQAFWPADVHMVGKDILRFHAVYWPAFLMAAGLAPPKRVFAHGWWTNEGEKISKSLGNAIDPLDMVAEFGLDPVRYFLMREVPFGNDGDYSRSAMIQRTNADLANDFGNLSQRVLSMVFKNCDAEIPTPQAFNDDDKAMLQQAYDLLDKLRDEYDRQSIHRALEVQWRVVAEANRYVDAQAPWGLKKTDPERMATVLYVLAEVIRNLAILAQPIVPQSAAKILDQLKQSEQARTFAALGAEGALESGIALDKPEPVFPRFVEPDQAQ